MIKAGDALPADVKLMEIGDSGPKPVTLGELTKGKTVVLFAVPGRLHAHLLDEAPAGIRREGRPICGEGRRRGRLPVGERRLRHGRLGQGAGRGRQGAHGGRRQRRAHAAPSGSRWTPAASAWGSARSATP